MSDAVPREDRIPSLRDIARVGFKHSDTMALIAASALLSAGLYCLLATPVYRSEAKVLVKMGREKLSAIQNSPRDNYNVLFQERSQNINNELEILRTPQLTAAVLPALTAELERARESRRASLWGRVSLALADGVAWFRRALREPLHLLGLARRLTSDERQLLLFASRFRTEFQEDTDVILLSFEWPDPSFAQLALDSHLRAYLKRHAQVHEAGTSHGFYLEQIGTYEARLREAEAELQRFLDSQGIANIELQKEILLKEIAELEKESKETRLARQEAELKSAEVRTMGSSPDGWVETPAIGRLGVELTDLRKLDEVFFDLKARRAKLIEEFQPGSPEVRSLDRQLERMREQKASSLLKILEIERDAAGSRLQELERRIAAARGRLERLNLQTTPLEALRRSGTILKESYLLYKGKAEELRISEDLNQEQILGVSVLGPPTLPLVPVRPRRGLIMTLAALFGLLLAIAWAAVSEVFDHGFETRDHVSRVLKVPLLASVPDLAPRRPSLLSRARNRRGLASAEPEAAARMPRADELRDPLTMLALALRERQGDRAALAIAGCNHGEGASTVAARLAEVAADGVRRVLLVDGNARTPRLHEELGEPQSPGLGDLVRGAAELASVLRRPEGKRFAFIAAGTPVAGVAIAAAAELAALVPRLREEFDWILVDAAPVCPYPDTPRLAAQLDGLLLVIRSGATKWEVGEAAKRYAELAGARLVGAVLNRERFFIPERVYRLL